MNAPVFFLALVFGLHIVAVNLGIALSTIVVFLKRQADIKRDKEIDATAYSFFRIYAATYGLAGVMGTAFTVFLLSFYPGFLGIAGNITMIPFGISIVAILLHFLAIVVYYYGWDKLDRNIHLAFGVLLVLTAYLIPLGFRAVFAFLNTPVGLTLSPKLSLDVLAALQNPTFLPLYLKSVTGALTAGFLFIAALLNHKAVTNGISEEEKSLLRKSLEYAGMGLFAMMFLGAWYSISLAATPIKFNNIFGFLGVNLAAPTTSNYSWLFLLKMVLVAWQGFILFKLYRARLEQQELKSTTILTYSGAAAGLLTIMLGEYLNAFSQYPYLVANAPLILNALPEPYKTILASELNMEKLSPLAQSPELFLVTAVGLAILMTAAAYLIYKVFFEKGPE
jgi:cytochrome d ubiquinol oxidase subunit I